MPSLDYSAVVVTSLRAFLPLHPAPITGHTTRAYYTCSCQWSTVHAISVPPLSGVTATLVLLFQLSDCSLIQSCTAKMAGALQIMLQSAAMRAKFCYKPAKHFAETEKRLLFNDVLRTL